PLELVHKNSAHVVPSRRGLRDEGCSAEQERGQDAFHGCSPLEIIPGSRSDKKEYVGETALLSYSILRPACFRTVETLVRLGAQNVLFKMWRQRGRRRTVLLQMW